MLETDLHFFGAAEVGIRRRGCLGWQVSERLDQADGGQRALQAGLCRRQIVDRLTGQQRQPELARQVAARQSAGRVRQAEIQVFGEDFLK